MRSHLTLAIVLWMSLTLACSPGGGTLAEGGIGGTGISSGPITAFGSIFVNDVEWDLSGALVELDGSSASQTQLELGMVVTVSGTFSVNGTSGSASSVVFDDAIEGPIESIADVGNDGLLKQIEILGQLVMVEDGVTRFDDDDPSFGFATMAVDDVAEVSGLLDDTGAIRATRIEKKGTLVLNSTEVELKGTVTSYASGSSFLLGGITINFDPTGITTDLSDLPSGVSNGLYVEVEGVLTSVDVVTADRIELEDGLDDDVEKASLEGIVRSYSSQSDFFVGLQAVDASGASFEQGDASMLADGVEVEVEGPVVSGVLRATKVELRSQEIRLDAAIAQAADVDVSARTLVLLGVEISVPASCSLKDSRDDIEPFGLANLSAGDFLLIRGLSDGGGGVVASHLERRDVDDVELRGPVDSFSASTGDITILGLTIATDGVTEFEDENEASITSAAFFAALQVGDLVSVVDDADGDASAIDVADAVELE